MIVHQYSENNAMHFSFNLLRIKSLYLFRALLAHLRRRYTNGIWYISYVLCQLASPELEWNSVCAEPPEDEQVMLETCRGFFLLINWIKNTSRLFHYNDILWCMINTTLKMIIHLVYIWQRVVSIRFNPLLDL
jgi:hypothetical protein